MPEAMQRRLAAIVSVDVVGYSRLMGEDEAGTLQALRVHRSELVDRKVTDHGGRIVKTTGDGLLLEFPSVIAAVECAKAVQNGMAQRNQDLPEEKAIRFRIGLHVGDIIVEDEDIFGDGVNIAARVEAIAQPGGIAVTDDAHRQVRDRLDIHWRDGGKHDMKNIARPVHVWHWEELTEPIATVSEPSPLSLPDVPSIVVLPFDNISGDPEQEYFVDGMTEDVTTALARFRRLFVIARNSAFTYKKKPVDVKQVGQEMGVHYVLEGSVRCVGKRIRVTAQLIDAQTGRHAWAERYDRDLVDIFDVQDELTAAITANVHTELSGSERDSAYKKRPADLGVWELYQRGMWHFYKSTKEDAAVAFRYFHQVIERAPDTANAHAALAMIAFYQTMFGYTQHREAILQQGLQFAEKAISLDQRDGYGYYALGRVCMLLNNRDRSISALNKSLELNPSSASSYQALGFSHYWFGEALEALPFYARAIRLSPHDPQLWSFHLTRSMAYFMIDEFDKAVAEATASVQGKSDEFWPFCALAFSYNIQGKTEQAKAAFIRALEVNPDLSESYIKSTIGDMHPPYLQKWLQALQEIRVLVPELPA